jgi:PPOX class probable F420-dependent enzyme
MDREASISRLRSARVGRIATVTPESRPHVVPFVFALEEEPSALRAYWAVDRKPKRSSRLRRLRNLEHNPAVEFEVDGYDEDWDRLWWVRAAGTGRIVDSDDERARALSALESKYPQYANAPPEGPVVAIEIDAITGWEASSASSAT